MKQLFLSLGIIAGAALTINVRAQQNQPDSIHIRLHENQNGTIRVLDTIVPLSQQQQLFSWMEANGWEAPPPPPPPGEGAPVTFEREIVIEGDQGAAGGQRVMFVTMEGDSIEGGHPQMIMISIDGDSMLPPLPPLPPLSPLDPLAPLPPLPPLPPMECMKVIMIDDAQMPAPAEGDVVFMRHPMPPGGGNVEVEITEKDTVINGETRKMIIKTERIILPPAPPTPPTPPASGKSSAPLPSKRDLVVYPNPASSIISVEFDIAAKEKTTLRVIDMNGKVVYTEEIIDDEGKHVYREINLSDKGKGTYTVEVKSANKVMAEKVILQ